MYLKAYNESFSRYTIQINPNTVNTITQWLTVTTKKTSLNPQRKRKAKRCKH